MNPVSNITEILTVYACNIEHLRLLLLVGIECSILTGDQAMKLLLNWVRNYVLNLVTLEE